MEWSKVIDFEFEDERKAWGERITTIVNYVLTNDLASRERYIMAGAIDNLLRSDRVKMMSWLKMTDKNILKILSDVEKIEQYMASGMISKNYPQLEELKLKIDEIKNFFAQAKEIIHLDFDEMRRSEEARLQKGRETAAGDQNWNIQR